MRKMSNHRKFILALLTSSLLFKPEMLYAARDISIDNNATVGVSTSGGNPNTYTGTADDGEIFDVDLNNDFTNDINIIITTGGTGAQNGDIEFLVGIGSVLSASDVTINAAGTVSMGTGTSITLGTGDLSITASGFDLLANSTLSADQGNVNLDISGALDASASGITIETATSGTLTIDTTGAFLVGTGGFVSTSIGAISITTGDDFSLASNASVLNTTSGGITINITGTLSLDDEASIAAQGTQNVSITTSADLVSTNGSTVITASQGTLDINVGGDISIDANGMNFTSTLNDISIDAAGDVDLGTGSVVGTTSGTVDITGQNLTGHTLILASGNDDLTLDFTDDITLTGTQFGSSGLGVLIDNLNITAGDDLNVDATSTVENTGSGNYNFNIGGTGVFAADMAGTGALSKTGAGSLSLTGTNTYTGTTTVSAGRLAVNGSITSNTTVSASGTLGGTGTITGNLTNNGKVAPGNSIGTTNLVGNYIQGAGGVFEVEVNDAGNEDLLDITGNATVNGTLRILPTIGDYSTPVNYTILSASGSLNGTFDTIQIIYGGGLLSRQITYGTHDIFLTLTSGSFSSGGDTPNQIAISQILDNAVGTGEIAGLRGDIGALSGADYLAALDSLSGATFATESLIAHRAYVQPQSNISRRMHSRSEGEQSPATGFFMQNGNVLALEDRMTGLEETLNTILPAAGPSEYNDSHQGFWLRGFGGTGSLQDSDYTLSGFTAGYDRPLGPSNDTRGGAAFSYTHNASDLAPGVDLDTSSYQLSLYASHAVEKLRLQGIAGYGRNQHESIRGVTVGPATNYARADYASDLYSLYGEGRYDIGEYVPGFRETEIHLDAIASVSYAHHRVDNIRESGAGGANLNIENTATDSLKTTLGLGLRKTFRRANESTLTPAVYAGWTHEHLDDTGSIRASFLSAPNSGSFTVTGAQADRDSASFGTSLTLQRSAHTALFTAYDGNLGHEQNSHVITAGFKITW